MAEADPLDDLGLKSCPSCLGTMEVAGSAHKVVAGSKVLVEGSAYWQCPSCGTVALN